ncbi:uncharacterized protein C15orf39 homolog isoform X2 [Heptranchias perlo]|uniref:uncharacterized protein C15orf39 homolog isoform X2 n=1 Tax=Heptranchias perlo TaxID=212740 RepID=UPI0035595852
MMANKRNLDCMDSLICSKIPRLENEHNGLSAGLCKPSPLPSYTHENPLKYTGSYLAYHLRNRDGTDLPGVWSQPRPYLQHMGNPTIQSQPSDASHLSSHLYRTEPETLSPAFQSTVNEKDKLDLVKDLMNVRSKWVTFVERQKNLRHGHNLPAVLCSSQVGKHNLIAPTLSTVHNCVNIAFPQPVYRNSVCYSGTGCSLENPVDHFHRRGQETEWRMPPPVTSSCLIASNDHLIHNQQYGNLPPLKNKSLHHGSGHIQVSSVGRITKETGRLPGVRSPLCQGYGTYNRNVLQDPRNSVLSHDNSNGNLPSHINTSIHNLQDFQKVPLHPFATTDGQQMQPPLYCDKLSPPKFPIPIQSKVLHSQNTISNQQNTGTYSSLHPHSYKAPFPGTGGLMPVSSSTFADQLSPGNSYPQPSESLGYPAHPPPSLQKNVSMTVPLIHPALQPVVQPSEFESQSPSRKNMSASLKDPANIKLPSLDMLQFRPRVIVDAQTDERCYNSLNSLYNKEYVGQQQLISKHSAFHPVLSGKHLKGTFERPVGSPADQRPKDIYMQEHMPSIHISSNGDHGRSTFSKESENINNKPVEGRLESPPKSYSISPTRKISEMNSSPASKEDKRATPPASPPMPVINNVFSLAPYKAYLEATGLFFSKCLKCQSDCDESLICSCSSENKTKNCRYGVIDLDLNNSSIRLSKAINELQSKNAELEKNNPSVCIESTNEKGSSGKNELNKTVSEKISLDIQHRDISLSPNHSRLRNDAHQQSSNCNTNCAVNHVDEKLGMNKMQVDTALDLSIKNKNQLVDVTQQPLSVSCGIREELKTTKEILNEKEENTTKSVSSTEKHESKGPSGKHGEKTIITASETSNLSNYHRTELNKKYKILRPAPLKVGEMNPIQPSEGINETNKFSLIGSVDPSTFILRPLKLTLPDVPKSTLSPVLDAKKLLCETKVGMPSNEELMQCEKPLKLTLPDVPKSTLSPVPEAKKPLCETKVSVPGNVELMPSESGTYAYFVRLHQSLCGMIAQSVAETSEEVLRVCLQDIEVQNDGKENPKLRSSLKSKNGTRNFEVLKMSKSKEIWLSYGQVQPTMQKLLSHLETYLFITRCPFPHVIRAGAIFIPICLVKEKLFSSLKGAMIDQVFQQHKIELRPTTLSEEKKLQSELKLQRCSSRLIKLLSLKQLPEIYTDLLNVLWHSCVKIRLETQCRHEDLPGLFSHSQLRYKAICRALDMPIPAPDDDFYHTNLPSHVGLDAPVQVCKMMKT